MTTPAKSLVFEGGRHARGQDQHAGHLQQGQQPVADVVGVEGRGEPGEVEPGPVDGEEQHQVAADAVADLAGLDAVSKSEASRPTATTKVRSNSSSSGVETRWSPRCRGRPSAPSTASHWGWRRSCFVFARFVRRGRCADCACWPVRLGWLGLPEQIKVLLHDCFHGVPPLSAHRRRSAGLRRRGRRLAGGGRRRHGDPADRRPGAGVAPAAVAGRQPAGLDVRAGRRARGVRDAGRRRAGPAADLLRHTSHRRCSASTRTAG